MDVRAAFRRAGHGVRGSLVLPAVVVSTLLALPFAYLGLLFLGLSGMCYDPGPSPEAEACVVSTMVFVVAPLLSTLAVPVVVAVWGLRLRRRGETGNRALLALLWDVFVVAFIALSVLGGAAAA